MLQTKKKIEGLKFDEFFDQIEEDIEPKLDELFQYFENYVEVVLRYLSEVILTSEKRVINQERENRGDHRVMLGYMRVPEQAIPTDADLKPFEEDDIILDVEMMNKVKDEFKKQFKAESAKRAVNKKKLKDQWRKVVPSLVSILFYVFAAIFVVGI